MALRPELIGAVNPVQIDNASDVYAKVQAGRRLEGENRLLMREAANAEQQTMAKNRLSMLQRDAYNPTTGKIDNTKLKSALGREGMFDEMQGIESQEVESRKAGYEAANAELDKGIKVFDFVDRSMQVATPENYPQIVAQAEAMFGKEIPMLRQQWHPGLKDQLAQATMSGRERIEAQRKQHADELGVQHWNAEQTYRYDSLNEQKRHHAQTAQNQGWTETVGKDGLPVLTQQKYEGMPVYSSTGISNKNQMPQGQVDVIRGATNAIDAVGRYREKYNDFGVTDLVNPDKIIGIKSSYKDVLLQGQQVYGLGVLNENDERALGEILTNPLSFVGTMASKQAMDKQIDEVEGIFRRMGKTAEGNYQNKAPGDTSTRFAEPANYNDDDIMFTAKKYGMTPEQVRSKLNGN